MGVPTSLAGLSVGLTCSAQAMHDLCMATKTISLRLEAYERLRRAKRSGESFSDVVMRARWPAQPATGGEFLAHVRDRGPLYGAAELEEIDGLGATDAPPADKRSSA